MTRRTAIQPDLFAAEEHRAKLERLGDPLREMEAVIDFAAFAAEVEKIALLEDQPKGGRPPYPIETMVRIVVLKRLYGLSDEQMEFRLLNRMGFKPKKHGKSYYGYKLSVCVDRKHKLIRRLKTDTASAHDSQHFEALLDSGNTCRDVYADRGYASKEREETLQAKGYRPQIQRKAKPHRPLSKRQSARNTRIARVRARVEHAFAAIEAMGGKMIRTIGQARADFALTLMAACYTLRRTAWLVKSGAIPW